MLLSDYRKLCMPPEISARILPFGKFAQLSGSRTECSWWLLQSNQNHQDRGYQDTFDVYDNLNMLVSQISASNMPHLLPNNAVYFAPQHASFAANAAAAACSTDSSRHSHTWRKIGIKIGENKCKSGQAYAKILHSQHVVPGDPRVRSYHDLPKYIGQPGDVINANVAVENAVQNDCERLTSTRAFCIYVYLEMLVDDKCHIMFQKLSQSQKFFFLCTGHSVGSDISLGWLRFTPTKQSGCKSSNCTKKCIFSAWACWFLPDRTGQSWSISCM